MDVNKIYQGDCMDVMKTFPDGVVNCCVTSPPYWQLRDYGIKGQIGLEEKFEDYIRKIVDVFREVRRVLRKDGTLWLNMGDSYNSSVTGSRKQSGLPSNRKLRNEKICRSVHIKSMKRKNLVGIPWRVAFALQADGWILRSDIIWAKPNPMPESVRDRPTKSHEYIFLMAKSRKYYYDLAAIKEKTSGNAHPRGHGVNPKSKRWPAGWVHGSGNRRSKIGRYRPKQNESFSAAVKDLVDVRNKRDVWIVPTFPFSGPHYATFPPQLTEPCMLAGCPKEGIVLDPFSGSGTTLMVAQKLKRKYVGIELNPKDIKMAEKRLLQPSML